VIELGSMTPLAEDIRARMRDRGTIVPPVQADLVVLALGDTGAAAVRDALAGLADLGKPVIVVLGGERPNIAPETAQRAKAVLAAWGLGVAGPKAVAAVLFGDANPGGKLPITIARDAGQLPLFYDAKPSAHRGYLFDSSEPLYAFGTGLSYSSFELGTPMLSTTTIGPEGSVQVSVEVRNNSRRAGDETVQLYVHGKVSSTTRPIKELKGFQRVTLKPGEKRTVRFALEARDLAIWNTDMRRVVEPGEYEVMTGPGSTALKTVVLRVRKGAGK